MHLPLAFSIHHFITSVGADAGFAAIVGLAILVLLYFAQARETSSLRDQSVSASQRVAELERRLAALGSTAAKPVSTPQAATQAQAVRLIPAAPAGVGAPALAAATRLIPLPAATVYTSAPARPPAPAPLAVTPPPATVAAASATPAPVSAAAPPPATTAGSNGTGEHAVPRPTPGSGGQPPRGQFPPGGPIEPPPLLRGGRARRPLPRRWLPVAAVLAVAVLLAAVLVIVTSSGGSSPRTTAGARTTNAPVPKVKAVFHPGSVTVAVLNGTDVFQLAHKVAIKLQHIGYKQGTVATAADQTHATTLVGFLPGHRSAAVHVATTLGLSSTAVAAADQSARGVACPPSSACSTKVIVTVGSDLSNTP